VPLLACVLGERVRDQGVGVPVAQTVLGLSQLTISMCLVSGEDRMRSFRSATGRPYFFSIDGK
jgi:hypothetical protein